MQYDGSLHWLSKVWLKIGSWPRAGSVFLGCVLGMKAWMLLLAALLTFRFTRGAKLQIMANSRISFFQTPVGRMGSTQRSYKVQHVQQAERKKAEAEQNWTARLQLQRLGHSCPPLRSFPPRCGASCEHDAPPQQAC